MLGMLATRRVVVVIATSVSVVLFFSSASHMATDHFLRHTKYRQRTPPLDSTLQIKQQQRRQQQVVGNVSYSWLRKWNPEVKNNSTAAGRYLIPSSTIYPYPLELVPEDYDIRTSFQPLGGGRYSEYVQGNAPYLISAEIRKQSDLVAESRKVHIRKSFQFAWKNYVQYAFGYDELKPVSGKGANAWGGQGMTLVDSLDTLWILDVKDEFYQARDWVRDHLDYSRVKNPVSLFEITIRALGGLLAAYDFSQDPIFLEKAINLGERLLHGFDGSTTGIPFGWVSSRPSDFISRIFAMIRSFFQSFGKAVLAEFGTIQIEFRYLANAAQRPELAGKTDHIFRLMYDHAPSNGLYPCLYENLPFFGRGISPGTNRLTFGAMADSFYEYMLKQWIQSGKTEPMFREMYDKSMDGMHEELLQKSTPSGLYYIADKNNGILHHKMDHLVCFMGGLFALGAYTDPNGLDSPRAQRDMQTARALTYTCYQMYARMNTGISPEFIEFQSGNDFIVGPGAPFYLLRPEAIESMFILNQLTGDPIYREWGWEIFQAIE